MFFKHLIEALQDRLTDNEYKIISKTSNVEGKTDELDNHLRQNRKTASLKKQGVGTSRMYYKVNEPEQILLDNKPATIHTGIKVPYLGSLDTDHATVGIEQNKGEQSNEYEPYHILRKDKHGNYHTNPNGILASTISNGSHWNEMLHTNKLSDTNRLEDHTKTETHPNGITHKQMNDMLDSIYTWKQQDFNPTEKHILKHPLMQKLTHLINNTKISHHDITKDNIGIWIHPHTNESHPVIIDYGIHKGMFTNNT